jgi:hypothetical protein
VPKERFKTPAAPVRWCKLLAPVPQYDPEKPLAWSCEMLLDNSDTEHAAWLVQMEDQYVENHGKAKKSIYAYPWSIDKEDSNITVVKFKRAQFKQRDGSVSQGPVIMDSKQHPWDPSIDIGNGSKLIIAFDIYAWSGTAGNGLSFQPIAAMVVDLVPYERLDPSTLLDPIEGGYEQQPAALPF